MVLLPESGKAGIKKKLSRRDTERQKHRQREKQAPCKEPNVGLNPGTPGSHPEPKADTQPLSHPDVPKLVLMSLFIVLRVREMCFAP